MKIEQIKVKNHVIDIVCANHNDEVFVFNYKYETLAIAKRYSTEIGSTPYHIFTVYVGNHNFLGGSLTNDVVLQAVKRYLKKQEETNIVGAIEYKDLAHCSIRLHIDFCI